MSAATKSISWAAAVALSVAFTACGGESGDGGGDDGDKMSLGEGPCDDASECAGDVCVALVDGNNPPIYCTQECGGGCPSGYFCDDTTFGIVGLDFCRFGDTPSEEPPAEPPRLPCTDDTQCESGTVCATYQGERGCTLLCDGEAACTPPSTGGITFDYLECAADQTSGKDRDVCLPDPACFSNPAACTSFGG